MIRIVTTRQVQPRKVYCATNPQNVVNIKTTGVSYYDDFLDSKHAAYLEKNKNLRGRIDYMTPSEYYSECAKVLHSSVTLLKAQRENDADSINYLTNLLESGKQFYLPYINYANSNQEGLHRMMVLANKYGWDDQVFPVLIVEHADFRRHEVDTAKAELQKAVKESIQYQYSDDNLPDDLVTEIQWKLDESRIDDEDPSYTAKCIYEDDSTFIISLIGFESEIKIEVDRNDIRYRNDDDFEISDDDLDLDIDDLDLESLLR